MPTLNHTRRAPPPPPLIRVFDPKGKETAGIVDDFASSSSSPISSPHTPDEFPSANEESRQSGRGRPYFQMRVKWLKRAKSRKRDSRTISVATSSTRGESPRQIVPYSARLIESEWEEDVTEQHAGATKSSSSNTSNREYNSKHEDDQDGSSRRVGDWVLELSDTSHDMGEVLLYFQCDQEPESQNQSSGSDWPRSP